MNDAYKLLYNNLWLVNKARISKLNPNYIVPLEHLKSEIVKPVISNTPRPLQIPKPVPIKEPLVANVAPPPPNEVILDWDKLVSTITDCKLCNLCENRKNVVIERGNRKASWMFVGEAPSIDDDTAGVSFVGQSGALLDKMIAAMKLDVAKDVYICNIVKCKPSSNRHPKDTEIAMCKNYLLSQIELVKPQVIIALGRFAIQTLLNSSLAIEKLRGKVHYINSIPLIATYTPTYLIRNPEAKKEAWDDLQLALKLKG